MSYIVVGPYQFRVSMPYEAGDIMGEVEANVLNMRRAELLSKIATKWVKAKQNGNRLLSAEECAELQDRVTELDKNHKLSFRKLPRPSYIDRMATGLATQALRRQGIHEPSAEQLEELKSTIEIQRRARQMIDSQFNDLMAL